MFKHTAISVFFLLAWFLNAAVSAAPDIDCKAFNVRFAEQYLMPRYQAFAAATKAQQQVLVSFCASPDNAGLDAAKAAFHATSDAWMAVQHISFGPVSLHFRAERIAHWPERRNAVGKAVRKMLSDKDLSRLAAQKFAKDSVAVQGLPALERLLFADNAAALYGIGGNDPAAAEFRCHFTLAVAANLASIAQAILTEWRDDVLPVLIAGTGHPIYFDSPEEVTRRLLTDLQALLQVGFNLKLARVLTRDAAKAKPKLAENWRSGRSTRNLELNLESAFEMYAGKGGFDELVRSSAQGEALSEALRTAFEQALDAVKALPDDLSEVATDAERRKPYEETMEDFKSLYDQVSDQVPQAAGVKLGFNKLDGD